MKHLLSLLLILSACYYGNGQTTQNVGYGAGTLSSLDSVSSYNFCMGWLACDFLIKGNYNIVIKAGGIAQTTDTSFVFLVDYDISYLKDRGDMTAVLRGAEKQMKQQPSLRTNVTYRKALYLRLVMLMQSGYGGRWPVPTPDSDFWFYFRDQLAWLPGGGEIIGDILDHAPTDSLIAWTPKRTMDSLLIDFYKDTAKPVLVPPDTNHMGEEVYTADELPKNYGGSAAFNASTIYLRGQDTRPYPRIDVITWYDTLHFSRLVPPGTVGWAKWCDTCQTVFFGFYHDGRISDYIGGFGRSKAAALPMVIAPCDLDDKTKWIQPL